MLTADNDKPRALLVGRIEIASALHGFTGGSWRFDWARSISELHESLEHDCPYDIVILDVACSSFDRSGSRDQRRNSPLVLGSRDQRRHSPLVLGMMDWVRLRHGQVPILILEDSDSRRYRTHSRPGMDGFLDMRTLSTRELHNDLCRMMTFWVLMAFPASLNIDFSKAITSDQQEDGCLRIAQLEKSRGERLIKQCRAACAYPGDTLASLVEAYRSRPEVRASVVATGWDDPEDIDQILLYGRSEGASVQSLPLKAIRNGTDGFLPEAVILYLAAQALLVGAAGLRFHREIKGCPLDYCADKLDVPRGMTKGALCEECESLLRLPAGLNTRWLTPFQIAEVRGLLKKVKNLCESDPDDRTGIPLRIRAGGTPFPDTAQCAAVEPLLGNLQEVSQHVDRYFDEYSSRERMVSGNMSLFYPIRHYNSHTPTIPGERAYARRANIYTPPHYFGGGYFLVHDGFGVVIDPGYDFLRLLYGIVPGGAEGKTTGIAHRGYTVEDIDLVVVTHDHLDHHADLETILRSRRSRPLYLYCTPEVEQSYKLVGRGIHADIRMIPFLTGRSWRDPIPLPANLAAGIEIRQLPALHWQHTYSLDVKTEEAENRLRMHLNAFGVSIQLKAPRMRDGALAFSRLLITGDTLCPLVQNGTVLLKSLDPYLQPKYWSRLLMRRADWTAQTRSILEQAFVGFCEAYTEQEAELVCAHIGTLEKWPNSPGTSQPFYAGHHLGLAGCRRLLQMMKQQPSIVLLSEFGEELIGHRVHLCQALQEILPADTPVRRVLPTDLSLCVDLRKGKIKCSRCDEWHPASEVQAIERDTDIINYISDRATASDTSTCQWR